MTRLDDVIERITTSYLRWATPPSRCDFP